MPTTMANPKKLNFRSQNEKFTKMVSFFDWKVNKQQSNSIGCISSTYERSVAKRFVDRFQQQRPTERNWIFGVEMNQKFTRMVSFFA
jgi:hypothetical protein